LDLFLRESLNSRTVTGVVLHIHVREQDDVLEHVAKIPFFHRCVGNILVINQYPSLRWRPYSRDYLDQRSFSAPSGSENRDVLAILHFELHLFKCGYLAETLRDSL